MDSQNLQHSELQWRFCTKHYYTYHEQLRKYREHSLCHGSGPVAYLAQATHLAGKSYLHCLPVCSAVA